MGPEQRASKPTFTGVNSPPVSGDRSLSNIPGLTEYLRDLAEALTPKQRALFNFSKAYREEDGTIVIPGKNGNADIAIVPTQIYLSQNRDSAAHVEVQDGKERIVFPTATFNLNERSLILDAPFYKAFFPGISERDLRRGIVVHEISHYVEGQSEYGALKHQFEFYRERSGMKTQPISDAMVSDIVMGYSTTDYIQARVEQNGFTVPKDLKEALPGGKSWRENQMRYLNSGELTEVERAETVRLLSLSGNELKNDPAVQKLVKEATATLSRQYALQGIQINSPTERIALENGTFDKNDPRFKIYEKRRLEFAGRIELQLNELIS